MVSRGAEGERQRFLSVTWRVRGWVGGEERNRTLLALGHEGNTSEHEGTRERPLTLPRVCHFLDRASTNVWLDPAAKAVTCWPCSPGAEVRVGSLVVLAPGPCANFPW